MITTIITIFFGIVCLICGVLYGLAVGFGEGYLQGLTEKENETN